MATYNGAPYITSQIRSLQCQTFTDWTLLVHDDGSTDGTVDIIRQLAKDDQRIKVVADGKHYHNCALNFMHLLQCSDAPFCIFCDQDDIWLENKLQAMLEFIESKDNGVPQAVYSNSYVYDPVTAAIGGRATLCFPSHLKDVLFLNGGVQGCALMFNASLRDICKDVPDVVAMHDHVVTVCAAATGGLSYLDMRLMLYRRHQTAVTGPTAKRLSDLISSFVRNTRPVMSELHYKALLSLYAKYERFMPETSREIFSDYFRFEKENRMQRFVHVLRQRYKLYGRCSLLAFKVLIRKFV